MSLTPAQLATLKAAIVADQTLSAFPNNTDGNISLAAELNKVAAPAFSVWRSTVPTEEIFNAISWASLTPADTADGTALFTNRALVCQAKQINLQILLQGRTAPLATGNLTTRQGLSDSLQNVPAGAGGALLDAGWAGAGKVKATITRSCTVFEKLYATGTGTTAVPGVLVVEGPVSSQDVETARNLP